MRVELEMKKWLKTSLHESFKIPPISWWICGLLSIVTVVLYGKYRCKYINSHKDVLEDELFKKSIKLGLDGWSITHFVGHMEQE